MDSIIYSTTGLVHLLFSILAMIFGAVVVVRPKGTSLHKKLGYAYVFNMVGCIVTSFMIYRLFKGWGIFHYMAVISTITLMLGMIPVIMRRPKDGWIGLHLGFMFWSVVGLYAAFISEIFTRAPWADMKLFAVVLFVYFGFCSFYFSKFSKKWMAQFKMDAT